MKGLTEFNKQCIFDCYRLIKECVNLEHIEDSGFIASAIEKIDLFRIAIPPVLYRQIDIFIEENLCPLIDDAELSIDIKEYVTNHSGVISESGSEEPSEDFLRVVQFWLAMDKKVEVFAEKTLMPYLQ